MTVSLRDVRQGIKLVLEGVDGIDTVYGFPHGAPTPPCATVGRPTVYDPQVVLSSGAWSGTIPVQVLVAMADNETADEQLDDLIDAIPAAFNTYPTVTAGADAIVSAVTDQGVVTLTNESAGVQYLAATFVIDVLA